MCYSQVFIDNSIAIINKSSYVCNAKAVNEYCEITKHIFLKHYQDRKLLSCQSSTLHFDA